MRTVATLLPLLVLMARCAGAPDAGLADRATVDGASSIDAMVAQLYAAGLEVRFADTIEQPFFTVPAQVYTVDGDDLQIYEFPTAADASAAASQVSATGGSIGRSTMSWLGPPHFFRRDRLVVNYLGSSEKTIAALEQLLGPQFAGSAED